MEVLRRDICFFHNRFMLKAWVGRISIFCIYILKLGHNEKIKAALQKKCPFLYILDPAQYLRKYFSLEKVNFLG